MKTVLILSIVLAVTNAKIIIIGAGSSGIAAATRLLENNVTDFLMLEAEHRIGGRINTIKFGANVQDIGAQWCHGEKGNVVFELAQPLGLLENSKFVLLTPEFINTNGKKMPNDTLNKILERTDVDHEPDTKGTKTLEAYMVKELTKILAEEEFKDLKEMKDGILQMLESKQLVMEAADSWNDLPNEGIESYDVLEGSQANSWKGRGYRTILDVLMKKIPDPTKELPLREKIRFDKEVVNINWDNANNEVIVRCKDGSVYEANRVLVTPSLGVLKATYETLFTPSLPPAKIDAIKGLGFGVVDKIIFEFPYHWWPNNSGGYFFIRSVASESDEMTELFHENPWLERITGAHPYDYQPNNLLLWITSDEARKMERLDEIYVKNTVLQYLRLMFKDLTVPEPVSFLRTQWDWSPHFRGSYSFNSLMTVKLNTSNAALGEPVRNSKNVVVLQFAGEATNPTHYSTVHGAIETGWREADRILESKNSI